MRLAFVPVLLILGGAIGFGVATTMQEPEPMIEETAVVEEEVPRVEDKRVEKTEDPKETATTEARSNRASVVTFRDPRPLSPSGT